MEEREVREEIEGREEREDGCSVCRRVRICHGHGIAHKAQTPASFLPLPFPLSPSCVCVYYLQVLLHLPNPHLILTLTLTLTLSFTGTLVCSSLRRTFQRLRVRFSVASDGEVRPNHSVQRLETTENHLRDERREREGNEKEQEGTQKKGKVLKVSWMGHHNILGSKRAWIIN